VLEHSLKPSRLCRLSGRNGGQFTEINRKRAAEQAVIELAKQETLAEEARKLAEITKKRAEEEAVVEAKRQQADAETRKAQAERARIAARRRMPEDNKRKLMPGLQLRRRLHGKKLSPRINFSALTVPMVSCSTATRCGRDISSPTSTTRKWTALKL
jgi:hypothetical protein